RTLWSNLAEVSSNVSVCAVRASALSKLLAQTCKNAFPESHRKTWAGAPGPLRSAPECVRSQVPFARLAAASLVGACVRGPVAEPAQILRPPAPAAHMRVWRKLQARAR